MSRLGRAVRHEQGSSALEVTLLLGVSALVVMALVGSGLTTRPASALQTAFCNLFSTGCTTDAQPVEGGTGGRQPLLAQQSIDDGNAADSDAAGPGQPSAGQPGGPEVVRLASVQSQGDGGDDSWWAGLRRGARAFSDGLILGDFNREDHSGEPRSEQITRAIGHLISNLLVYGDIRDFVAALRGGGGLGRAGRAGIGVVPGAGDLVRGVFAGTELAEDLRGTNAARGDADPDDADPEDPPARIPRYDDPMANAITNIGPDARTATDSTLEAFAAGSTFAAVWDPATQGFLAYPSGATHRQGEVPDNLIPRYDGHHEVALRHWELTRMGDFEHDVYGFTLTKEEIYWPEKGVNDGSYLAIDWHARSVNALKTPEPGGDPGSGYLPNPTVPEELRQAIAEDVANATGLPIAG